MCSTIIFVFFFLNFYVASSDHTARLWSVEQGAIKREFNGHQKAVTALAFSDALACAWCQIGGQMELFKAPPTGPVFMTDKWWTIDSTLHEFKKYMAKSKHHWRASYQDVAVVLSVMLLKT